MTDSLLRWVLALFNALGVVGVGTYLAGHRKTGIVQMIISLTAFGLTLGPVLLFYRATTRDGEGIWEWYVSLLRGERWESGGLFWLGWALLGVFLFAANWLWGWTTTRPCSERPPPLPRQTEK